MMFKITPFLICVLLLSVFAFACSETPKNADSGVRDFDDTSNIGNTDAGADTTRKVFASEPLNHRVTAESCDNFRPTLPVSPLSNLDAQPCSAHSDCTQGVNGRCSIDPGIDVSSLYCTYDKCFADNECMPDEVCNCGNDVHVENKGFDANRCVPSNCKTDSDCSAGHWCKASPSIDGSGVIVAYFCTTDADECRNDIDCEPGVCFVPFDQDLNSYFCGAGEE